MTHSQAFRSTIVASVTTLFALALLSAAAHGEPPTILPKLDVHLDSSGAFATYQPRGATSENNAFFESLGTNGRTCGTCHQADQGWTIAPPSIRQRYQRTRGTDPLFAAIDGANCNDSDNHSLLLSHGLIRISLPISPVTKSGAVPQFQVTSIDDPYNCQLSDVAAQQACADSNGAGVQCLSMYRRPLPATNLKFLSTTMWDGREPGPATAGLTASLTQQAIDATTGHAQAVSAPTSEQLTEIVNFELGLFSAQLFDFRAAFLYVDGATGDPETVAAENFYFGINDALGGDPEGDPFNPVAFTLYAAWQNLAGHSFITDARKSIARGENIFNTRTFQITNVAGLNAGGPAITGTCTTCHDTPNIGNHSFALPLDIGTSNPTDPVLHAGTYLPVFHLTCVSGPLAGQTFDTTDIGRGLITGNCADISKVKGPILHELSARAPYFHNGAAASLSDAVNFYDTRFSIGLSAQDKADLVAFLQAL